MRSILDDLARPLRRGFGPTVGNDPNDLINQHARGAGYATQTLPVLEQPIAPSQQFARIDAALPDDRIGAFVNQSRADNPFTLRQRAALIRPYGYRINRIDQLDQEP